jgi:hypothetical protein
LTSSQITSLQNSVISPSLVGDYQGIYSCPALTNSYKYICYPETLPTISTSINFDSASPPPFNEIVFQNYSGVNYYIVSVTVDSTQVNYRVYRTASRSNNLLRIQIT